MNLTPQEIVLVTVAEADNRTIQGRTLLQKRLYFLDVLLGLGLSYRPYYYGPYSPLVDSALGELQALRFLEEHQRDFDAINEEGFQVRRYDAELTKDGEVVVGLLKRRKPSDYRAMAKGLQGLQTAKEPDYATLSIAAKIHYILTRQAASMTVEEIQKVGKELNWKIEDRAHRLQKAIAFLERLDLVKQGS